MKLQYDEWKNIYRLDEAATVPFRSMKRNRDSGTLALYRFQLVIVRFSQLPAPRGGLFGPFDFHLHGERVADPLKDDYYKGRFGQHTELAVQDIQSKLFLSIDGIAGIETLSAMDDFMVSLVQSA